MKRKFDNETMETLYQVLNTMKKDATYKIGKLKAGKMFPGALQTSMKRELVFREKCVETMRMLNSGIVPTKKQLSWLKKDQHDVNTMMLNLADCIGQNHSETDNLVKLVFG